MSRYYSFLNESFDKMYLQETSSNISAELDAAYDGWYYTITGAGGNLEDWKKGYQELLDKENIGTITKWIEFKGKDMNDKYGLTGDNRYPDDLTFLAFAIDGLNTGKLAMFKLRMSDRWFTDIVDNNKAREGYDDDFDEDDFDDDDFDDEYDDDFDDLDESLKEAKISPEDARDNEILKNIYKTRYSNKNAKLSAEEKDLLAKNNLYANKRWIADNDSHMGIGDAQFKNDKHNHIDALRKKPSRYKSKDWTLNNYYSHHSARGEKLRPVVNQYNLDDEDDAEDFRIALNHYDHKIKDLDNFDYNHNFNAVNRKIQASNMNNRYKSLKARLKDRKEITKELDSMSSKQKAEIDEINKKYADLRSKHENNLKSVNNSINWHLKRK